jgi:hypothetical protein
LIQRLNVWWSIWAAAAARRRLKPAARCSTMICRLSAVNLERAGTAQPALGALRGRRPGAVKVAFLLVTGECMPDMTSAPDPAQLENLLRIYAPLGQREDNSVNY